MKYKTECSSGSGQTLNPFHYTLLSASQKHNTEAKEQTEEEPGYKSQFILLSVSYL